MIPIHKTKVPDAVETLVREHRSIERLLDALEQYGDRLERGALLPRRHIEEFVAVLRGYADTHHHEKEEQVLFRAMVDAGMSGDEGTVAFMLTQHEEGRRLVGELTDVAEDKGWTDRDRQRVARLARDYVVMLRAHIREEDEVVYPLARVVLRPATWADVDRECAELDAAGSAAVADLLARLDALTLLYPAT